MKKLSAVIVMLMVALSLWAGFGYELDLLSFEPLHKEYTANRDRAGMDFQWLYVDQFPEGIWQDSGKGPEYYPFYKEWMGATDVYKGMPWMGLIHLGETLSLFRNTFTFDNFLSPISFDFSFQGAMVLGMEGAMADMIGYDGVFFYGGSARIADMVSLRLGFHHFSTHYGDGTLKSLGLDIQHPSNKDFLIFKKYIRMEAIVVGLSVEPVDWLRLYVEYNFMNPVTTKYFDTEFFAPTWWFTDGKTDHVYGKDESYRADIVNFGVEFSYPIFPKLGNTTIAYDCHAFEEGRIVYKPDQLKPYKDRGDCPPEALAYYDRNLPWEFEHSVLLSQELNDSISIELGYHYGRFPLNSMYFQRTQYGHIGIRFNPDSTVKIVSVGD